MKRSDITILVKPTSAQCNLGCKYCFYSPKENLYQETYKRMDLDVLEIMIKKVLEIGENITFCWQGGEPTLMGLPFYKMVIKYQEKYRKDGQRINNAFQTNGILIDEEWAEFFKENNFLVGLSIDGPSNLHDEYRLTKDGKPTHHIVLSKLKLLQRYKVDFNILTVVNDKNSKKPEALFRYFRELGVEYMQFIPCLEKDKDGKIAGFSVDPVSYGNFLCIMFDKWYNNGKPECYIREYEEWLIAYAYGVNPCMFKPYCEGALVIEYNGDVYPCDFFVEPEWYLGNIREDSLEDIYNGGLYRRFSERKHIVDERCLKCKWLNLCWGGCPKFRIDKKGKHINYSYYCSSYQKFFNYADKYFKSLLRFI
ncbi:anaerobic sulfatase maturase [bacterium]|nr:anaerobic sulfatase maturase [bacterium]